MGHALIWAEGLAVALLALALAASWASRGKAVRLLWVAAVFLTFFAAAATLAVLTGQVYARYGDLVRNSWFLYSLSWLLGWVAAGVSLVRCGLGRPEPGLDRRAAGWSRGKLWLGLAGSILALGFTFWNMDLASRADLAIARQEAGAFLHAISAPPVAESENAARVYAQAVKEAPAEVKKPWAEVVSRGLDAKEEADWKDPYVVNLVKQHDGALALFRKGAAMPRCSFERYRGPLDAVSGDDQQLRRFPRGAATLLAVDARVKASQGDLQRAFEDVTAILGVLRHVSAELGLIWTWEVAAWRALEDVLRLAPAGKGPLPALHVPELPPLVRRVREEQALLGLIWPAAAAQPSLVVDDIRKRDGAAAALLVEAAVIPSRVFLIPDETAALRKLIEDYHRSPRLAQDETPKDWADLRQSSRHDPAGVYGVIYTKPKHQLLAAEGASLAALRQTARAGLAVAAYQRRHGKYPDKLEQLVPDFLPGTPVDPRDGQPLRIKRSAEAIVIYAPADADAVESGKLKDPDSRRPAPIFRLYPQGPGK